MKKFWLFNHGFQSVQGSVVNSDLQVRKEETAYFSSIQVLPFGFAEHY